jgi:hypothetical protein
MIIPSKFTSFGESALGKITELLDYGTAEIKITVLYHLKSDKFECIDHFLYALDVLYVLGKIDIDLDKKVVVYAN